MLTAIGRRNIFGVNTVMFRVPTRARGDVFMRVDRTGTVSKPRAVVEVDSAKFLVLWRADPYSIHSDVSYGSPDTWPHDRKFPDAEEGFLEGEGNPVPLADVNCHLESELQAVYETKFWFIRKVSGYRTTDTPYASFDNGITRTIWLMTHGASHFPVSCDASEAPLLQAHAGAAGGEFQLISLL